MNGDVGVPYKRETVEIQTIGDALRFLACGAACVLVTGAALWAIPVLLVMR